MVPKKPFMNQKISYINGNCKIKLCNVSAYIKEFLRIIEIENKNVSCSLNGNESLDDIHTLNAPRKIYHPKCTILEKDTIVLDVVFKNYFKE